MKIYFKNILIIFIAIGVVSPYFSPIFAQEAAVATAGARSAKDAALLTKLGASVGLLQGLVAVCDTESAVLGTGPVPYPAGFCEQNTIFGSMFLAKEASEAVGRKLTFLEKLLEVARKIAIQAFKKVILDRLVDALIAYISGQTDSIIEDWDEFFDQAADLAVGEVAQQLNAGFLCSNFDLNLRLTLLPVQQFSKGTTCSLTSIIGNIDSFIENFENGGWIGYQEQWYPQNNFYGATLTALDEVSIRGAKARGAALAEGVAGGGFLSQKKCDPDGTNCRIVTPGDYIATDIKSALGIQKDIFGILTATEFEQYIAAIVNAGINRLAKMGIDGLRGVLKKRTADFTTTTPATPCAGLTGDAFRSCIAYQQTLSNSFQNDQFGVLDQINATLRPRQEANEILDGLITNQTELVDSLAALAACRPNDLNVQNQVGEEQEALDDLLNKYEDNLSFIEPLEQAASSVSASGFGDWGTLSELSASAFDLSDPSAASDLLTSVNTSQVTIQANIDAKLPGIKDQLQACGPSA